MANKKMGFNSKLIHAGTFKDQFGSATVPIYQTSTFSFENAEDGAKCFAGEKQGYIYTRIGNPTIRSLEKAVAELENGTTVLPLRQEWVQLQQFIWHYSKKVDILLAMMPFMVRREELWKISSLNSVLNQLM
jgi:methionine-gamma-lyase